MTFVQFFKKFWSFVTNSKNLSLVFFVLMCVAIGLVVIECSRNSKLKKELNSSESNVIALTDTVRIEKTKNGELEYIKTTMIGDIKNIKQMNEVLYDEIQNQKEKVYYISQMTTKINDKTSQWSNTGSYNYNPVTGMNEISWNFDTTGVDWSRKINGKTIFKTTSTCSGYSISNMTSLLTNSDYSFKITTGIKKSKTYPGKLEIFVKSSYPNMVFENIDGAIVNPEDFSDMITKSKTKNWSFGPYVGIGYGLTLEKNPSFAPVLSVGLSLQYKIISF